MMMKQGMALYGATLLLGCALAGPAVTSADATARTCPHPVRLSHPAINQLSPFDGILSQQIDAQGFVISYSIPVDSVICGGGICEVIEVHLFWDLLGNYLRLELPPGGNLTKRGHAAFSVEDYAKLDRILSDEHSLLQQIGVDVVAKWSHPSDAVDGVTGATTKSEKEGTVDGALYTCYTLWHWAHGPAAQAIRSISAATVPNAQLARLLQQGTDAEAIFAGRQLTTRKQFDPANIDSVITRAAQGSDLLMEAAIAYFRAQDDEACIRATETLFLKSAPQQRIQLIKTLSDHKDEVPNGLYDRLSHHLPDLRQLEIHHFLGLIQRRDSHSETVVKNVVPLLDHSSFLIARRAFYFLIEQPLTTQQELRVQEFRKKFEGRL
jgi:hypothetical protein